MSNKQVEDAILIIMGDGTFTAASLIQEYFDYGFTLNRNERFFVQHLYSLVKKGLLKKYYGGGEYYYRRANLSNPFVSTSH